MKRLATSAGSEAVLCWVQVLLWCVLLTDETVAGANARGGASHAYARVVRQPRALGQRELVQPTLSPKGRKRRRITHSRRSHSRRMSNVADLAGRDDRKCLHTMIFLIALCYATLRRAL